MKNERPASDFFAGIQAATVHRFGTGEIAHILSLPMWRLQRLLENPRYRLAPEGRLGVGRGSRRVFRAEDIYRIAAALYLVRDGFSTKLISRALRSTEDVDLFEWNGEEGCVDAPNVYFVRGRKQTEFELIHGKGSADMSAKGAPYYVLNLDEIVREIDRRICAMETAKRSGQKQPKKS